MGTHHDAHPDSSFTDSSINSQAIYNENVHSPHLLNSVEPKNYDSKFYYPSPPYQGLSVTKNCSQKSTHRNMKNSQEISPKDRNLHYHNNSNLQRRQESSHNNSHAHSATTDAKYDTHYIYSHNPSVHYTYSPAIQNNNDIINSYNTTRLQESQDISHNQGSVYHTTKDKQKYRNIHNHNSNGQNKALPPHPHTPNQNVYNTQYQHSNKRNSHNQGNLNTIEQHSFRRDYGNQRSLNSPEFSTAQNNEYMTYIPVYSGLPHDIRMMCCPVYFQSPFILPHQNSHNMTQNTLPQNPTSAAPMTPYTLALNCYPTISNYKGGYMNGNEAYGSNYATPHNSITATQQYINGGKKSLESRNIQHSNNTNTALFREYYANSYNNTNAPYHLPFQYFHSKYNDTNYYQGPNSNFSSLMDNSTSWDPNANYAVAKKAYSNNINSNTDLMDENFVYLPLPPSEPQNPSNESFYPNHHDQTQNMKKVMLTKLDKPQSHYLESASSTPNRHHNYTMVAAPLQSIPISHSSHNSATSFHMTYPFYPASPHPQNMKINHMNYSNISPFSQDQWFYSGEMNNKQILETTANSSAPLSQPHSLNESSDENEKQEIDQNSSQVFSQIERNNSDSKPEIDTPIIEPASTYTNNAAAHKNNNSHKIDTEAREKAMKDHRNSFRNTFTNSEKRSASSPSRCSSMDSYVHTNADNRSTQFTFNLPDNELLGDIGNSNHQSPETKFQSCTKTNRFIDSAELSNSTNEEHTTPASELLQSQPLSDSIENFNLTPNNNSDKSQTNVQLNPISSPNHVYDYQNYDPVSPELKRISFLNSPKSSYDKNTNSVGLPQHFTKSETTSFSTLSSPGQTSSPQVSQNTLSDSSQSIVSYDHSSPQVLGEYKSNPLVYPSLYCENAFSVPNSNYSNYLLTPSTLLPGDYTNHNLVPNSLPQLPFPNTSTHTMDRNSKPNNYEPLMNTLPHETAYIHGKTLSNFTQDKQHTNNDNNNLLVTSNMRIQNSNKSKSNPNREHATNNNRPYRKPRLGNFNISSFYSCTTPVARIDSNESIISNNFSLSNLWDSFEDASIFGLEIPFVDLNENYSSLICIPFLSALVLYTNENPHEICFKYIETAAPHKRKPFVQLIRELYSQVNDSNSKGTENLMQDTKAFSDQSWIAIYWKTMQREFNSNPSPTFLVFYKLKFIYDKISNIFVMERFGTLPDKIDFELWTLDSSSGANSTRLHFESERSRFRNWLGENGIYHNDFEYFAKAHI